MHADMCSSIAFSPVQLPALSKRKEVQQHNPHLEREEGTKWRCCRSSGWDSNSFIEHNTISKQAPSSPLQYKGGRLNVCSHAARIYVLFVADPLLARTNPGADDTLM